MSFPDPPVFTSGAPNSGWWKYQDSGTATLACQTQGLTLEKNCQRYLRTNGVLADTIWGSSATRLSITIDGIFGPATCKVLAATLIEQGKGSEVLADLEADYRLNNRTNATGQDYSTPGAPLSMGTLRAMIWAASHERGDPNRVVIPPGYVPPRWGVAPANDGAAASLVSCWNLSTEPRPVATTEPASHPTTTTGTGNTPAPTSGGSGTTSSDNTNTALAVGLGAAAVTLTAVGIGLAASKSKKRKG